MRILLINPIAERYTRGIANPLGLLSIATYLDRRGHEVKILDRSLKATNIKKELESYMPDVVGVSVYSMKSFTDSVKVSKAAQKFGVKKVVWGGPFVSLAPKLALDEGCVDIISIGEGEETWLELLTAIENGDDLENVKGLAFFKNGELYKTADREFMDLSKCGPIDFKFIDVEKYLFTEYGCNRVFALYMSKGCIGSCAFCYNREFHRCTYRARPVEDFLSEVKYLVENHGVDCIYFADELWCVTKEEMQSQCRAFKASGIDFKWGVQTRIGIFDGDDFKTMYDAGCRWIDFGIESGSPSMLKKIRKGIPYDKIEPTFEACSEAGLISLANFIVGFPDETPEQLMETIALAKRIKATQRTFFVFIPGPGSQFYRELTESGRYVPPKNLKGYTKTKLFYKPDPNFSQIPEMELRVVRAFFLWKSFSRKHFSAESKSYSIAKKDIQDVFKQFRGHGIKYALQLIWISAYEFLLIFCDANFHPRIKKKYGLKLDD